MKDCHNCNDRTATCHATCEDYLKKYNKNRKADAARLQQVKINFYCQDSIEKVKNSRHEPKK